MTSGGFGPALGARGRFAGPRHKGALESKVKEVSNADGEDYVNDHNRRVGVQVKATNQQALDLEDHKRMDQIKAVAERADKNQRFPRKDFDRQA